MDQPQVDLPTRTCSIDLTPDLSAPRTARRLLTLLLEQWGLDDQDLLDSASIVVSELVTNALVHDDDGGPITLALELRGPRITLSVADRSPGVPAQRVARTGDEGGRGLSIVSQLASRWGVEPTPSGKRVFAELPVPTSCCA